ncbi:FtsX-like permease family protein [Crenothrix sp.]|uniref:ABC transporter permease n=1 Tax=Crenothrix sp. TaxID=3100433 RepID=UPI00374C8D98
MSSIWAKIKADLLAHPARTGLSITSMAIGIFMLGTMLGMMDLELSNMDAAHRHSSPSHISLILKTDTDFSSLEPIKSVEGVEAVDTLTQFTVRYKTPGASSWQLGTVVFRNDYSQQKYDQLTLLSGQWPSGNRLAVERLSMKAAGLKLGDTIQFETTKGAVDMAIGGVIRHPFVKPPKFGGQLHFFISSDAAPVFGVPLKTFRQALVRVTPPYSADKARIVAANIRTNLAKQGIHVNATLLQDPEKHWGRPFFSGINLILTVMAWASLALSSVLILNTVAAVITQQTDQIGIMKSIGAKRRTIAGIYLTIVFLLALMALILAIPASFAVAFLSSRWLLDLFNIELTQFTYSTRALLCMVVGGLLTPLLAGLWPIWRGASLTIREALASYGLGADYTRSGLTGWLETKLFGRLPTLYAVALGNLLRRKARLFWTQSVLIIAGVLFMVIMSLIASVNLTLDHELARSRYAVRLGFGADQPAAQIEKIVKSLPKTTGVELWNRLSAEIQVGDVVIRQVGSLGVQLVALPVTSQMYTPLIVAGRWFEANDAEQNVLVLNAETAELNDIKVGDSVQVNVAPRSKSRWKVIGLYRWFAGSGYAVEPVYAPLKTVQNLTHNTTKSSFALLSAAVTTLEEEKNYADALKQKFQDEHIPLDFYTTLSTLEQRQFAKNEFRPLTSMLLSLADLIASVGGIGLSGTLAMGVLQRTREIGVLRAIGAKSSTVFKLFMLEGFLHGFMAWAISIPIAYLLAEPLAKKLGQIMLSLQLDYVFSMTSIWLWLALIIFLVIVSSYWPAKHATKIAVRDSLSY